MGDHYLHNQSPPTTNPVSRWVHALAPLTKVATVAAIVAAPKLQHITYYSVPSIASSLCGTQHNCQRRTCSYSHLREPRLGVQDQKAGHEVDLVQYKIRSGHGGISHR